MLAAICATIFLIASGLVLLSIDAVEQNQYGLMYNWITKTISTKVYHGGTHFIGFWNSFEVFPATVQTIEFSDRSLGDSMLHTRTKEGLGLHLAISFQYTLDPKRIPELYRIANTRYEGLFRRIARDQLLEAASEYEGPQYWLERHNIGDHMSQLVKKQMQASCADLWALQLLRIDLPDKYENSITMTQVQKQLIQTRKNEQVASSIRADTEVMKAQFSREIQVVNADAQANFTLETKLADAEAVKRKITAEADMLGYVRNKLKLTPEATIEYQEMAALSALPNATFLANVPEARVGIAMGGAGAYGLAQTASKPAPEQAPAIVQDTSTGGAAVRDPELPAAASVRGPQFLSKAVTLSTVN